MISATSPTLPALGLPTSVSEFGSVSGEVEREIQHVQVLSPNLSEFSMSQEEALPCPQGLKHLSGFTSMLSFSLYFLSISEAQTALSLPEHLCPYLNTLRSLFYSQNLSQKTSKQI